MFGRLKDFQELFPNLKNNPEVVQPQRCHDDAEAKSMIPWTGTGERSKSAFAGKGKPASGGKGTWKYWASGRNQEAA